LIFPWDTPLKLRCNCPASNDLIEFTEKTAAPTVYVTGKFSSLERGVFMHAISIALLLMFLQRPDQPQPPILVVTGNAQVFVAPDQATVRLGVVRQSPSAQTAQEQANVVAQEIVNAVAKVGVPASQIQTMRLVLSPVYAPRSPDSRDAPRIVAYNATNTVSVRVENLSAVGPVIDAALKAGANQLEGVQFGLRNDLPSRQQALKQAVEEARSKAQTMADALRVNLAEVLEASEGGVTILADNEPLAGRTMALAADTPVSPGQIRVNANVSIRYRITSK